MAIISFDKINKIPIRIVAVITVISCISFLLLYSAAGGSIQPWAIKQIFYFLLFLPLMILVSITDIKIWYKLSYLFYTLILVLVILVELTGHTAMGATRWINLGIIKIQPSELMKICLVFALARYFHDLGEKKIKIRNLFVAAIILFVPAYLIIRQPDLGTGMIVISIGITIFFLAGVNRWIFVISAIILAIATPLVWSLLYTYQKNRILTFISPESDPLGSGYNVIQSKIAIGSGGIFGKGFIMGTQSQLSFLPEHQTDFIFTLLSEEWGFVGGVILILLYSIIIFYGYLIGLNARSKYAKLLALGITTMLFLHIFINIAMVMGLLPAVGVPLPLLSYGGTMMGTALLGLGLIINVHIHYRHEIKNALKSFI